MATKKASKATAKADAVDPKKLMKEVKKSKDTLTASDIDVHLGLDAVRAAPQVYVNALDNYGLFIIVKEPLDNAKDEHVQGHGNRVTLIREKNTFFVIDEGRSIPIEIHKTTKKPALETVLTTLSAGSKMRTGKDAVATGGVHGMGVSITNALSDTMQAWVWDKKTKSWYTQKYAKGKVKSKVEKTTVPKLPFKQKVTNQGTVIAFTPDFSMFDKGSEVEDTRLREYMRMSSYIYPKCVFQFVTKDGVEKFHEPKGFESLVTALVEEHSVERSGKALALHGKTVHGSLQWTTHTDDVFLSFANGTRTTGDGKHVDGFYKALLDALKPYRKKSHTFGQADLRGIGLIGVINALVIKPVFTTQTKEKLASAEAAKRVYDEVYPILKDAFSKNKSLASHIIKRATANKEWDDKTKANKKDIAALKTDIKGKVLLPAKLAVALSKDRTEVELFIVEGDSAGGTAKGCREKKIHEVLPLKGKPINVFKNKNPLADPEVKAMLQSIGYDLSDPKNPTKKLRVGRIIFLTDPDPDGGHIDVLLLAFFQKIAPELISLGMIYMVENALFVYSLPNDKIYGTDKADIIKKLGSRKFNPMNLTRIKGWGEVGPDILGPVAFEPKVRRLIKIEPMNTKDHEQQRRFKGIVGEDTGYRKEMLGITV